MKKKNEKHSSPVGIISWTRTPLRPEATLGRNFQLKLHKD